ncbi:tyrosine-type recombinase/integrase [Hoeflea sp. YIM 152468]|uniref:tyrosine-type recombinase/integrase n=1 Tax=Hoeflea sp. YIM 152468 TaxID=3031759 RepID=UPI0023DB7FB2|nr:tyrosine-type recombinase/integrase [Hoeflea sp. YIM 152468]MDF1606671.1 tyrosine-type recombinase/integrase [Hoeflea sp. YIM 152468]
MSRKQWGLAGLGRPAWNAGRTVGVKKPFTQRQIRAIRTRAMAVQQKTGRPVQFEITADVRASLRAWLERRGGTVEDADSHALRRTKAAMIDKATGNLRAIQFLLGHTKIENTVRYLGVGIEDALDVAEHTEIWS